jgi:probable HAF family extracellular repeat protein
MQDLGTLPNNTSSWAQAINDSGQVVGQTWNAKVWPQYSAFLWEDGSMRDLGTLGASDTSARAINNSGQIVGDSGQAFLWQNGIMEPIGPAVDWSMAVAINNSGQVLLQGSYGPSGYGPSGVEQAYLWQNGSMQQLPLLPNFDFTIPYSINDSGQVVGTAFSYQSGPYIYRAFIYQDGAIYNLNDYLDSSVSGWLLRDAYGINNHGQIVAYGYGPSGASAVLLTPVPEPTALSFMALGFAIISKYRKR